MGPGLWDVTVMMGQSSSTDSARHGARPGVQVTSQPEFPGRRRRGGPAGGHTAAARLRLVGRAAGPARRRAAARLSHRRLSPPAPDPGQAQASAARGAGRGPGPVTGRSDRVPRQLAAVRRPATCDSGVP